MGGPDSLAGLGLEAAGPGTLAVDLEDGVRLDGRLPTGIDWSRARAKVADVFEPADRLREAQRRYAWSDVDRGALADPATWEGVGEYVIAVELAAIVVAAVHREADGRRFEVAPSVGLFASLFRRGANLDRFMLAARAAERELIRPKKDAAPAPSGSTAGAPSIATAADGSGTPAPTAG